jgi:hypothetical protein
LHDVAWFHEHARLETIEVANEDRHPRNRRRVGNDVSRYSGDRDIEPFRDLMNCHQCPVADISVASTA